MRILFLEPPLRTDKLAPLYLSAILKQAGHQVHLCQCRTHDAVLGAVLALSPDFILYSATSGNHRWYLEINRQLKRSDLPVKFVSVMGGPHFTYYPEDALCDPTVDFVVCGPGENVIVDLIEGRVSDKQVWGTVPQDINALPPPDRAILYKYPEFGKARMKRFIAGRDCRFACSYCFNHLYHRIFADQRVRFFQRITPRRMVNEIKQVQDEWGLELAYFNDDDLAQDQGWLYEFLDLFKTELGLHFCGSVRADSLNYPLVCEMARAGCVFLNIALESVNPSTQKLLRRGRVTNAQIIAACRWCTENDIKIRLQNMAGLPVPDPLQDALDTLEFNIQIADWLADSWVAIFQPFRKTDIWHLCLEKGLISPETECGTFFDRTPLDIPDAREIENLAKWWHIAVRERWSIDMVRALIKVPLVDEQRKVMQELRWREAAQQLYEL